MRAEVIAADLGDPRRARPVAGPRSRATASRSRSSSTTPASAAARDFAEHRARAPARDDSPQRRGGRRPDGALRAGDGRARAGHGDQHGLDRGSSSRCRAPPTMPRPRPSCSASARRSAPSCGSKGITVTALCPGPVRTEFMEAANLEHTEETTPGLSLVDRRRGRCRRRPRRRAGEAGRGARDLEPRRRPHGPALAAVDRAAAGQADLELRDTRLT